jgi:hypothetical protein
LSSGGFPGGPYIVGTGNPQIAEDWYYASWAYNSWDWINNPNNNCTVIPWDPINCQGKKNPSRPPFDGSQDKRWYPYQELVWGYAAHPPTYNGVPLWQAVNLSLPTWANVGGVAEPHYPNNNLPRPLPSHTSCGSLYLPIVMKNSIGVPCNTYTTLWYPTGSNTCNPAKSNCAQGDGQPDNVWAGSWSIGYHQVEFSPQLVLNQTYVGTYWKTTAGVYGNLYIQAKLDGQWVQVKFSQYQGSVPRWEEAGIGQHAGKYISGLRFGFSSSTAGHTFAVDGYRIRDFMACGN